MAASQKSFRASFKIAAIYVFALSTAVACSKFEPMKTKIGEAKVTQTGPAVTPNAMNVTVDKVSTIYLGVDADDETNHMWNLKMDTTHGSNKITFDVAPMFRPAIVIGRSSTTIGTMDYQAEGVCGDQMCSKFAVMLTVKDSTNGTTFQRVQFWNLMLNNQSPQKDSTNTTHANVRAAYDALSGETLAE